MGAVTKDSLSTGVLGRLRLRFASLRISVHKAATGAAAVLALSVGYHVVFGANGLTVFMQKRQETIELRRQLQSLAQANDRLKSHVDRLQSDPDAIEQQAREQLRYTRSGEVIVALPAETQQDHMK